MAQDSAANTEHDAGIEALLHFLKNQRGFDLSGYKRPGLTRRIQKRMHVVGCTAYPDYQNFLLAHPEEFTHLFNGLLINVTSFFRDPESWKVVSDEIVPRILERRNVGERIRIWSAGCSSGEEAYTLVMVLAEAMGVDRFKKQVKIYATDLDDHALAHARASTYGEREVERIPPELRARYFEAVGGRYAFRADLRRFVIFGRNDLSQDAPISHLDLLVCRNALMYFNADAQSRILSRFHFALNDDGYLFLGRAEMLLTRNHLFRPLNLKARIFTKVGKPPSMRERLLVMPRKDTGNPAPGPHPGDLQSHLQGMAWDAASVAQLVLDGAGNLVLANEQARTLFRIDPVSLGRPFHDLPVSYQAVEIRSRIERAYAERRPAEMRGVEYESPGGNAYVFDVQVAPLLDPERRPVGVAITFSEVTSFRRVEVELQHANEQLETAFEELQATNEELETTNEEMQSTVEELETTNEELQSTNEELETMNEEIHSTNQELEALNDELQHRTEDLNRVSGYMEAVLSSLRTGVAVLDRELRVAVWNHHAADLWGLRQDEVESQSFAVLDIGLPVAEILPLLQDVLEGRSTNEETTLPATNRRGRALQCRVAATPLRTDDQITGVILTMEESLPALRGPGTRAPPD